MAHFHCTRDWMGQRGSVREVSEEEAEQLKKQGEFVTEDPFTAMNWELD